MQTYSCRDCGRRFRNQRREKVTLQKFLWKEYVFAKQTIRELKKKHDQDRRVIKQYLENYQAPPKSHFPRKVNLVADALYFGERKENRSWCLVALRCPKQKENLWWACGETETTSIYLAGRRHLESLGYQIMSVTGDGFAGLRQAFSDLPFQMCQVHMERIIVEGTTRKPELEAGKALLALGKILHYTVGPTFRDYVQKYLNKYRDFLNEKTINPLTGETFFTHAPLRGAALSLVRFLPYLFTFEELMEKMGG